MKERELETVYEVDEEAFLDGVMYPETAVDRVPFAPVPKERWTFACYRATICAGMFYAVAVCASITIWKDCSRVVCVGEMYGSSVIGFVEVILGSILFDKVVIKRIAEYYEEILERNKSAAVRKWGKIYFAATLCLWVAFSIYLLLSLNAVSTAAEPIISDSTATTGHTT